MESAKVLCWIAANDDDDDGGGSSAKERQSVDERDKQFLYVAQTLAYVFLSL